MDIFLSQNQWKSLKIKKKSTANFFINPIFKLVYLLKWFWIFVSSVQCFGKSTASALAAKLEIFEIN